VKVCFPLFIVISVICMCILKVSCSVFLNWVYWPRGNFSGGPGHVHICLCVAPLRGVPGRYEYIWLLCWSGCRAGTNLLSFWLCFGLYLLFEQVGGVAGQYDFSSILPCFGGSVRLKWWGGAVFRFSLSSVCC
jgi:hypothetical protein